MRKKTKTSNGKTPEATIREIHKKYGKGSLMKLSSGLIDLGPCVSTGSISLDFALGGRGIPFGRVVEIFGPESSGKTTLALHLLANVQKQGYVAAMIDAEHALDPRYASRLGVNIENLLFSQPDYGEQALGILKKLIKGRVAKVIVIDSVAALVPRAELEGEMEDVTIGLQARLMSGALRQIVGLASKRGVLVIFINQERDKIAIGWGTGGTTTPGGKALKFWSSIRIQVKRRQTKKEKGKSISNWTFARVAKSKICPPFRVGEFFIVFGKGIHKGKELFHWAQKGKKGQARIIKRKGNKFTFDNVTGKGQAGFLRALKTADPKVKKKFIKKVRTRIKELI